MCGIVGYIGDRDCADVLVNSLENLNTEAMTQQESLFLKMV